MELFVTEKAHIYEFRTKGYQFISRDILVKVKEKLKNKNFLPVILKLTTSMTI